ncbi:unnamed protein product [Nezara viridula]|uniref:alkaline phosphatase n=1 Tax=Nezara viridula TaxID=85310 RepID=A0A9P0HKX4_NEZVI|nr:unnamed protein product [Nezara viridula]
MIFGKATGVVTNTRVTHATPAAAYAHSASRYWEDDSKIPPLSRRSCKDIARQLVEDEPGRNINVSYLILYYIFHCCISYSFLTFSFYFIVCMYILILF